VPVSGTVTIDGKPLTRGYIFVMPKDARAAGSEIDAQGKFVLTTNDEGDGCKPGTHVVTVISREQINPTTTRHLIPPKYADPTTSETTVTIKEPTSALAVDLTWDGGKPYVVSMDGQGDVAGPQSSSEPEADKP
jgi:hypothetical protein